MRLCYHTLFTNKIMMTSLRDTVKPQCQKPGSNPFLEQYSYFTSNM